MVRQKQILTLLSMVLLCGLFFACTPDDPIISTETAVPQQTASAKPALLPTATPTTIQKTSLLNTENEPDQTAGEEIQHTIPPTPDLRLNPEDWQKWPVIPTISANARAIYQRGLAMGNNPNRFSKVGDCQNITTYFLALFDYPARYRLGPDYDHLQEAIVHFNGSFSRKSMAVAGGMNVASVFSHYWADKEQCAKNETPLHCELRLNQPSLVLISMEETWGSNNKVENYEKYMRQIIETVIEAGAVPIIATKADNKEGDHLVNQTVAKLAHEYDIPMWNFWLAVQPLPNHGILEDGFHLTQGKNYYDDPNNLKQAWPVRNLTALQVIDSVWRQANPELP